MIVADTQVPGSPVSMGSHTGIVVVETRKKVRGGLHSLGNVAQDLPLLSDVQACVEIPSGNVEVTIFGAASPCHLGDHEEIILPEDLGVLFDGVAKVARLVLGHMLERVNAITVDIGKGNPVVVHEDKGLKRLAGEQVEFTECLEI